jgi:hypothetical protein
VDRIVGIEKLTAMQTCRLLHPLCRGQHLVGLGAAC